MARTMIASRTHMPLIAQPPIPQYCIAVCVLLLSVQTAFAYETNRILVMIKPNNDALISVYESIKAELDDSIHVNTLKIDAKTRLRKIDRALKKRPKLVITIGNGPLQHYIRYQKANASKRRYPPTLVVAALHADVAIGQLINATGITYEIPAVTSLVSLRSVYKQPIKRVAVIYRKWLRNTIQQNRQYSRLEDIELVPFEMPNRPNNMTEALKQQLVQVADSHVDALWVVNDSVLINAKTVKNIWSPQLKNMPIPVIVGVEPLANSRMNFGNFAVFPDHQGLGLQTVNKVYDIIDEGWRLDHQKIDHALSINKVLNLSIMKQRGIAIDTLQLGEMDKVID